MRVGILGGGQLAQMIALAGIPLGMQFTCLEPQPDCSASSVADILAEDYNESSITKLAGMVDVLTFESENIPSKFLDQLTVPLYPSLIALQTTQDRLLEKQFLMQLNLPLAEFIPVDQIKDLSTAATCLGFPYVLKTRRQGYDGKGQYIVRSEEDAKKAFTTLVAPFLMKADLSENRTDNFLIAEKWIGFDREVSLIAVRSQSGQINFYPMTENVHSEGILRLSKAPFLNDVLQAKAERYLTLMLEKLDYIGVLAVEFFVLGNDLLVNEMAPRVHNSGHWTIEGAITSQFSNHLRAISNLPLGDTQALHNAAMVNFIGEIPPLKKLLNVPSSYVHIYGKTPKIGRKLGHLTQILPRAFSQQDYESLLSLK